MADCASLPADLVARIADRVRGTDDLGHYMDFRAVCHGWRSATDDPKANPRDRRFLPRRWAALDEVHQSDARLFVNIDTGRFVRKDLPPLRRYFFVAGAGGGLIVLAERSAPHAARVLNPFTGSIISFKGPVPPELDFAAHVIDSSSLTIVLVCLESRAIYWADADDESFHLNKEENYTHHPLVWMALAGGIYAAARERKPLASLLIPAANSGSGSPAFSLLKSQRDFTLHPSSKPSGGSHARR